MTQRLAYPLMWALASPTELRLPQHEACGQQGSSTGARCHGALAGVGTNEHVRQPHGHILPEGCSSPTDPSGLT
jgi:hypothetical protein